MRAFIDVESIVVGMKVRVENGFTNGQVRARVIVERYRRRIAYGQSMKRTM